jgi:hypothetical protein
MKQGEAPSMQSDPDTTDQPAAAAATPPPQDPPANRTAGNSP